MSDLHAMPEAVLVAYTELELPQYRPDTVKTDLERRLSSDPTTQLKSASSSSAVRRLALQRTIARNSTILRGCSAIQISNNWILAHGSLLYPLIKYTDSGNKFISNLEPGKLYSLLPESLNDLPLYVYGENSVFPNTTSDNVTKGNQVKVAALWKCPLLTKTLENFFASWLMETPEQSDRNLLSVIVVLERLDEGRSAELFQRRSTFLEEFGINENSSRSTSRFRQRVLKALEQLSERVKAKPIRGQTVEIISTPFGNPIFLGTLTRGVIGKVFGKKDCLLLTDANAFPGSEGAPLYMLEPGDGKAICGMVIATTCWCRGERTDYTFAANLTILLEQILQGGNPVHPDLPLTLSPEPFCKNHDPSYFNDRDNFHDTDGIVDQSLAVVRCGRSWGTGILMNKTTGTFVTCAHVVAEAPERQIRITSRQGNRERTSPAQLVYKTSPNEPYDVAVITVNPTDLDPLLRPIRLATRRAHKGEEVLAAGFPFSWASGATISSGIVSKSLECMLQTSCCVQSGASGGAIVTRENHRMLGMVVCNAVASSGTALYPRLSMAIPITVLQQPLLRYWQTYDPTILQALTERDLLVRKIWKLSPVLLPSNM